jgi:hypothetical protein
MRGLRALRLTCRGSDRKDEDCQRKSAVLPVRAGQVLSRADVSRGALSEISKGVPQGCAALYAGISGGGAV